MANCTVFSNFTNKVENKSLQSILKDIASDKYKDQVENIRDLISQNRKEDADHKKKLLLAFTPSGTFDNLRKAKSITKYSGFIILDYDDINDSVLSEIKERIKKVPYTYGTFISPSGNGLKVIVKVSSGIEEHTDTFIQVTAYYDDILQINSDPSGKDVSRLCFMSYDHQCYINQESVIFPTVPNFTPRPQFKESAPTLLLSDSAPVVIDNDFDKMFISCVEFTTKKSAYIVGNRNNFIHSLACNCNRAGIPEAKSLEFILHDYDLDPSEINTSVHSAYANNPSDFAKIAMPANFANFAKDNEHTQGSEIDYLKSTPTIPLEAIALMPNLFQDGAKAFETDPRKRDVFLTSAFCIISGCLPNVQGVYHQERVFPHLFSFVIAPAASGKGVLKNAKRLGDKIHERLLDQNKRAKDQYESDMADYKTELNKRKREDAVPEKPQEPVFKMLYIPADCSQAMMMQILQDNNGKGIICETEADAMSGANKQDWGNYSHILRAAFHHEKISAARKTNRELLEIKQPQLAVSLSGTPSQVPKLIASAEDGLFSRFMFYAFKNEIIWQDPSPRSGSIVYNDHFEDLSIQVLSMFDFLEQSPTEVFLSQNQWDVLNQAFYDKLNNVVIFNGEDAASVVYRLGLILFRFCMIFTALRKFENGDCTNEVTCTDDDFETALILSDVYLQHSLLMFNNLGENKEPINYKMPNNKKHLLEQLPIEFQRKEAIEIGKSLGLSSRSVDNFLNSSVPMYFEKVKTGHYRKI